jgi:hypothetical protein
MRTKIAESWPQYLRDAVERPEASTVPLAWATLQSPEEWLPRSVWRRLFSTTGYTVDSRATDRPSESVTLYRGAPAVRRFGMAWTPNRRIAEHFAAGEDPVYYGRGPGRVWMATVEPWRLCAYVRYLAGRIEDEYVIDTRNLRMGQLKIQPDVPRTRPAG